MIKPLLSTEWFSRLSHFNKLIIGFSGGLDSTVLLHVLASHHTLLAKLIAVHVNHGISANASRWQLHCQQFCQNLGIPLITQSVQFDCSANIEERARIARYAVFSSLLTERDCLILGHHLNDQAETVLLQLFRGSGVDGLAAMPDFGQLEPGKIARPFLTHSREQLEHYAVIHQLSWIEDESNQDINYSRNYLRQHIMPLLKRKWPGVAGNIARTALHCQQAKRNLDMLAVQDVTLENLEKLTNNSLLITPLKALSRDRIANVLRVWLKNNQIQLPSTVTFWRLIDEVIFASPDATPVVSWGEVTVRRYQKHLYLDKKNANNFPFCTRPLAKLAAEREVCGGMERRIEVQTKSHEYPRSVSTKQVFSSVEFRTRSIEWSTFPLPLVIPDANVNLLTQKANQGLIIPANSKIFVRFRQGGEEFFLNGQTKRLKKLFQEWGVPPWLRERVPLIYFNDKLAAVVGYAMSDLFFTKECPDAWVFVNCSF